ncbi:MAG TPA: ATP-binding protein [Nocardioides sp.]|nr:ATP-binding protein [Nocardioides sp.]
MNTPPRAAVVLGLLVLMTSFGVVAVVNTPDGGRAIGIWPVALATATLMVSPRPPTRIWVPVLAVLAVATIWVGGRPLEVAIGLGVGIAAEVWVTWRIACRGRRERAALLTQVDLARFLVAVSAGALTMAVASLLTSVLTGWGSPLLLALTIGSSSLAAQLTLLPFFCRFRNHPAVAGPVERCAQWAVLLAVTVCVFVPTDFPSLVLLVLPVLAWGALRNGSYESLAQMAVAVGISLPLTTYGYGPFARPDLRFDVPADVQGILLAAFACVCALVVLALLLTVGEQYENARQAAGERDRIRNIVAGIDSVAVIGADLGGRVTLFNPGAERLLGYDAAEVLGRTTQMLHSVRGVAAKAEELGVPNDLSEVASALMGAGPSQMGFVRKDGEERQHWMSLNRVIGAHGEVIGYVSTSEDITERLRAEARLLESLDAERQAVEQLREVDRVKEAFVSSVSHELRTPITSILGYTELLGDSALGALNLDQRDAVDRISRNSNRLLTLISELLTLSKLQAEGHAPDTETVDLAEVVAAGLAVISPTVARRDVELTVDLPPSPVQVTGDREMLERVVINLTDNAVKFTPDGGRVSVALTASPGQAVLEVTDTGIGVPAHEQQRLFDRFFRSSLAQDHAIPGSGLGLSIAHKIVENHGGTLEVCSEAGKGSTFRVRLPA